MGIISGSGSFRGRFGDHFRVGDHFGVGIISGAVQVRIVKSCDRGLENAARGLHNAVAFENFDTFIDTDLPLPPLKNSSRAKLYKENDVIFIDHVLNLVLRLSLLWLRNEVAMCVVSGSSRNPVFTFASRPGLLSCRV